MKRTVKSSTDPVRLIQPGIGPGFLKHSLGGKDFMTCLVELIKNCRDWEASMIHIFTVDRTRIRILDNGRGMNWENRNSFCSINESTGGGSNQSAKYGSGRAQMIFSFASQTLVLTAPEEEPHLVYEFEFGTEEIEEKMIKREPFAPRAITEKNNKTWPHEFRFGTDITFVFENPRKSSILRGDRLASELSLRLMSKFEDIVTVDDKPLPKKEVQFALSTAHPQLDQVSFELFLKKGGSREELTFASHEVGEVPMNHFAKIVNALPTKIPDVYTLPEVGGTIIAPYFREYVNQDRVTFDTGIADDPRTVKFIKLLEQYSLEVQKRLGVKMRRDVSDDLHADLKEIARTFRNRYGSNVPEGTSVISDPQVSTSDSEDENLKNPIKLQIARKEFELGESVEITAHFRGPLKNTKDKVQWHTNRSRSTVTRETQTSLELIVSELGDAVVNADIPGTPHAAKVHFTVVQKRVLRLSTSTAQINIGSDLLLTCINVDTLRGEPRWEHSGVGKLNVEGARAVFSGTRVGEAIVTVRDSGNIKVRSHCDVVVKQGIPNEDLIPIRDEWFSYIAYGADATNASPAKPIAMSPGDKIHRIMVNTSAPGYRAAADQGILQSFLSLAIALEFPSFQLFELQEKRDQIDPRDIPQLLQELAIEGYKIFEEIAGSKKR